MNLVIQNISTFKQIFMRAIYEYQKLNLQTITDIIDQHLKPENNQGKNKNDIS